MSRRYDPSLARRHWVYTREDLCRIFSIGDSTVTNWIRRGLEPIDDKRPQLFGGSRLRRFLTEMRWPHGRSPDNGRLFCNACFGFKALIVNSIQTAPKAIACYTVRGQCIDCHNVLQATVRHTEYPQIMAASRNTAEDSSDVIQGGLPGGIGRTGASIPPETRNSNLRRLHAYRCFLESHEEWAVQTVDEHLRAVARMSAIFGHKPFETIIIADVCRVKEAFRHLRDLEPSTGLSKPTVGQTLDRCRSFVRWLERRSDITLAPDLSGYFKLSRKERSAESAMVKGTSQNFDQALRIFAAMSGSCPAALRNRAIIALFISTGMRIGALISLRGKHVNVHTRWIDQDPREVDTKLGKHIRTYCLDLGSGLLEAIRQWARWRELNGFGDDAPFFLPDRYIQQNGLGLGYRPAQAETPQCWKSEDPAQRIIKDAAQAAGIAAEAIASHDFRRILHPFFARRGAMMIAEEVALQLNLGQTPTEIIRKHYAQMLDREREEILDELCRRALSHRTELELYLAFERNMLDVTHPDFTRAKDIYQRNARSEPAP